MAQSQVIQWIWNLYTLLSFPKPFVYGTMWTILCGAGWPLNASCTQSKAVLMTSTTAGTPGGSFVSNFGHIRILVKLMRLWIRSPVNGRSCLSVSNTYTTAWCTNKNVQECALCHHCRYVKKMTMGMDRCWTLVCLCSKSEQTHPQWTMALTECTLVGEDHKRCSLGLHIVIVLTCNWQQIHCPYWYDMWRKYLTKRKGFAFYASTTW